MNKQELLEQVNGLPSTLLDKRVLIDKSAVLELVDQLEELKKVVIPRFVAEWVEYCKKNSIELGDALTGYDNADIPESVLHWYDEDNSEREELFARAWVVGYEVEQEKLYTVEIPDPNNNGWKYTILYKVNNNSDRVRIGFTEKDNWRLNKANQLTEAEIKKYFEWAWQWAEEVE